MSSMAKKENDITGDFVMIQFPPKIQKQLDKRGWTEESVRNTINNPYRTSSTKDKSQNDPATAYLNEDNTYVVLNNRTGVIVQVSNRNDPKWQLPF